MKIYSSRARELNPLAKFAGKDLWIDCYYYAEGEKRHRFFKVLKANAFESKVESLPAAAITQAKYFKHPEEMLASAATMHLSTDEVDIIEPLTVYTTEEVMDMFNQTQGY